MKKLLLGILILQAYCLYSQIRPEIPVSFYNKGKLLTSFKGVDSTALYIKGSILASSDEKTESEIVAVDGSKILITGHIINNVKTGTVFSNLSDRTPGIVEFKGDTTQWITTDGLMYDDIPSKTYNYIDFPDILINNSSHVIITPELAVKTKNIDLTKGWLIVDSRIADEIKDYSSEETINVENNTVFAHLHVDGDITYRNWESAEINERGFIQVNMALANEGIITDPTVNEGRPVTSLVGFGSPFEGLWSDYFMFNILIQPDHTGFFGYRGEPNRYPDNVLKPGRGNILTVDLKGTVFNQDYAEPWSVYNNEEAFNQRVKDGFYYFNRHLFSIDPNRSLNQVFGNSTHHDAYQNEKLTNNEYIEITLYPGYNYLANPFLTPLSIEDLLIESDMPNSWNVIVNGEAGNTSRDIYNGVWILNPDSKAEYKGENNAYFNYTYRIAQNPGGTVEQELIAPLQMFVVWAAKQTNIRIPKSARAMGNAKFLRRNKASIARQDDFIIEIKDEKTHTSDRTSFVLRPAIEIDAKYSGMNVLRSQSGAEGSSEDLLLGTQLYTLSSQKEKMLVHFLSTESTEYVQLYTTPSYVEQEITLRGYRLNTMTDVKEMWLEDKVKNSLTAFTEETRYRTVMKPTDREDRFIIHFKKPDSLSTEQETIIAYYKDERIYIEGFTPENYGSLIFLYNISGNLLTQNTAEQYRVIIPAKLIQGTYLLRILGNSNQTIKLLVK